MSTIIVQQTGVVATGGTPLGTYTPNLAVDLCREFLHGYPVFNVQARACDAVNSILWRSFPWRWTLKALPSFSLIDNVQDYANVPVDILRLIDARVVRTDVTPNQSRELDLRTYLSPENLKGSFETLRLIAFEPVSASFRLDLRAAISSPQTFSVMGRYQFLPPRITDADLDTIFYFPDVYFDVFVEGLKWKFYQLADDDRAGEVKTNQNNQVVYSGQLGSFMDILNNMKATEDYGDGQAFTFPSESFGGGRAGSSGLFGR